MMVCMLEFMGGLIDVHELIEIEQQRTELLHRAEAHQRHGIGDSRVDAVFADVVLALRCAHSELAEADLATPWLG